jgi:hypothetical protein
MKIYLVFKIWDDEFICEELLDIYTNKEQAMERAKSETFIEDCYDRNNIRWQFVGIVTRQWIRSTNHPNLMYGLTLVEEMEVK